MNHEDLFWAGVALALLPWILMLAVVHKHQQRRRGRR